MGTSPWRRWILFNGVGAMGMFVQLCTLSLLVRAGWPPAPATAVAVELALLHNFFWHQRWTWRDHRASDHLTVAVRLLRFHMLNGVVSLVGNVLLVAALTGRARVTPLLANVIAIAACSLINYAGSARLVFRRGATAQRATAGAAATLSAALLFTPSVRAAGEEPVAVGGPGAATVSAWRSYEQGIDRRFDGGTGNAFFAQDAFTIPGWRAQALTGRIAMTQLESPSPGVPPPGVPDGKIHHWAGAIFVPGLTVERVIAYLESHGGRESESYEDVTASRLLERQGDRLKVFMRIKRTKVITATYNTEHDVTYRRISGTRASGRSIATKIAELADAGTPREREKRPDEDNGFLWRLNAYWRYEATAGGVLIECESVSLSRDVPFMLRFMISGMVEGVARDSLERTLMSLRRALTAEAGAR